MATSITLRSSSSSSASSLLAVWITEGISGRKLSPWISAALKGAAVNPDLARTGVNPEGRSCILLGLGEKPATAQFRLGAGKTIKALKVSGVTDIEFDTSLLSAKLDADAAGRAIAEGLTIATFETRPYAGSASTIKTLAPVRVSLDSRFQKGFREGLILGRAVNTSRELAATPPNVATPEWMAQRAKKVAATHGLSFRTISGEEAKKLNMGGLLAVGAGSAFPPRLLILEWNPSGKKTTPPILLVGKTVTYDSGGYSIKPDGGKGMKVDKAGGCTMLAVMEAVAQLKIKARVVCILAVAENMIDSKAYRLDDVITHHNGVTCEITNTDAEGRLVLADALAWGTKTYSPIAVIDAATLTGGVLVALGKTITGAFSNDDALMAKVEAAAGKADERVWRLPLDDELRKMMRSSVADLHNSAPVRYAHAGAGAAYLSFFVGEEAPKSMPVIPWVHLDIAGTAVSDGESDFDGLYPKGPTGWGVRTLTALLASF